MSSPSRIAMLAMTIEGDPPMPLHKLIVFLKRATGIGYRDYPPIRDDPKHIEMECKLREKRETLYKDLERLEKALRNGH